MRLMFSHEYQWIFHEAFIVKFHEISWILLIFTNSWSSKEFHQKETKWYIFLIFIWTSWNILFLIFISHGSSYEILNINEILFRAKRDEYKPQILVEDSENTKMFLHEGIVQFRFRGKGNAEKFTEW